MHTEHSHHFVSALPGASLETHYMIIKLTISQEVGGPPTRRLRLIHVLHSRAD